MDIVQILIVPVSLMVYLKELLSIDCCISKLKERVLELYLGDSQVPGNL